MPKCKTCNSEMLRGTVDLGTVEGEGQTTTIVWICPHAQVKIDRTDVTPQVLIYCSPKTEAKTYTQK